jgi:hypothetical protein
MPFHVRPLNPRELSRLDFAALGVVDRRVPPWTRDWAIDPEREVLCTQLVSDTSEMREGWYWYLLIVRGEPTVFRVDAFGKATLNDRRARNATIESTRCPVESMAEVTSLAREAHMAVSYPGEDLVFPPAKADPA